MFTPLTTYQKQIGKLGYELLKNNGQIPNSGEEFCEGAGDQPSPREEENKNYTVTINGEDLTISKIYNQKKRKFTCNCKWGPKNKRKMSCAYVQKEINVLFIENV